MNNSITNWVWFVSYLNSYGIWVGASYNAVMNSIFGSWGFNGINDYTECYPCKFVLGSVTCKAATKTTVSNNDYYYNKPDITRFYYQDKYASGGELKGSAENLASSYNEGRFSIYPKSVDDILNAYDYRGHGFSDSQFNNVELKDLWFCEDWKEDDIK